MTSIQLFAKGVQDEYFTGNPSTSFFKTVFARHTEFSLLTKEVPFYSSSFQFGTTQLCEISRYGDIIRSITIKVKLPSMFVPTFGYSYPALAQTNAPIPFYYMDESFTVIDSYASIPNVIYYNTQDTSWLPVTVTFSNLKFQFSKTIYNIKYIAFTSTDDALFWGFKNYVGFVNGYYIFTFTGSSEQTLDLSGWVNSYYPFVRYYTPYVGVKAIKSIDLHVGGQLIETITSDWIVVYNDLFVPEHQQKSLDKLLGGTPVPSTNILEYYVKIPFSLQIPTAALWRQDVRLTVNVENAENLSNISTITNFSNLASFSQTLQTVGFNGSNAYAVSSSNVYIDSNATSSSVTFKNSSTSDGSNVYIVSTSNTLVQCTPGNINQFSLSNCAQFSNSYGIIGTDISLINYTGYNAQNILLNKNLSVDGLTSPSSIQLIGNKAYMTQPNTIVIHDIYNGTVQNINCPYGTPIGFSQQGYVLTNNALCTIDGTLIRSFTNAVSCVSNATVTYVFQSDGTVYPPLTGFPTQTVTKGVITANKIFTIGASNGLTVYNLSTQGFSTYMNGNTFSDILLSRNGSNVYTYSNPAQIGSFTVATNDVNLVSINLGGQGYLAQVGNSNVYLANSTAMYTFNESLSQVSFSQAKPTINNEKTYFDGRYVYTAPTVSSNIITRYDTHIPFSNPCAHSYTTLNENISVTTINTDGKGNVLFFSNTRILFYNTNLPFENENSFSFYSLDSIRSNQNFTASQFANNTLFLGSTKKVSRYLPSQISSSYSVYSDLTMNRIVGTAYDNYRSVYVFPNTYDNTTSNCIKVFDLVSNLTSNVLINEASIYNSTIQFDPITVFTFPSTTGNILKFTLNSTNTSSVVVGTCPVANSSNTLCIAGSNVYSFPSQGSNLVYMYNTTTSNLITFNIQPLNYTTSSYDGSRYIYLYSSTTLTRFDTLRDQFVDLCGHFIKNLALSAQQPSTSMTSDDTFENGYLVSKSSSMNQNYSAFGAFQTLPTSDPIDPNIPATPVAIFFGSGTNLGFQIPDVNGNNQPISSWGQFTAYNSPIYKTGSSNNWVTFSGGTGPGRPYMTGQINVPNASTQGKTVFAQIRDRTSTQPGDSRFLLATGFDGISIRNGQAGFTFSGEFLEGNQFVSIPNNTWINICFRSIPNTVSLTSVEEIFIDNNTPVQTITRNSVTQNNPFVLFGQSEFGDIFDDPYWKGDISTLIIYDRALTNAEVQTLMTNVPSSI
jgi:hypothetical protein